MKKRDFLRVSDLSTVELGDILDLAARLQAHHGQAPLFAGKHGVHQLAHAVQLAEAGAPFRIFDSLP